ncbi:sugar ABC transporter ATP-binding protein [Pseudaminobacter sp. 19-2017]|uniref:Sugar ABC transporter ATP-binding protein n=1 Tax=Pseudaminobacter soli (ex Zhang et al. 2022) TaxID=2831468 RepID=A0A942I1X5_9HYPH|nr:sugar ABC transporter ATP-binding protein [Pseudaminobacter soli]MBS3647808.1 sugar ABC transporter ATP-binding protein [Pseudaminobacter soli]
MSPVLSDVVLSLEDVSKVYSGTVAVKHATFDVRRGAVNVLVGENGAGKSTMMRMCAGVEKPTSGRILLDGEEVTFNSSGDAVARGIGMVFQELNLFGNMTVAENIFATREITNALGHIDHKEQERRAGEFLDRLQAGIKPTTMVEDLTIGQQQLVEIAKAVSLDARVLIMDEPTSALSAAEVEILFKVIADLKARGVAIVYISHRLEELIRIGDYITVLRDGRITGQEEMRNVDTQWIVRQMIGSDAKDFAKPDGHEPGGEVFRAEEISLPRATGGLAVDHVSLSLRAGEILGIYGLMGAGRSELFDCIMGRHGHATGRIYIEGREVRERDPAGRIRRGLALIPEDRQREGLVTILSVASNLTLASLQKFAKLFHIRGSLERGAVREMVKDLSIKVADPDNEVSSLSGGNQQKVVIGKALLTGPKVLLMDEPSRGIDVGAKADVFRTMRRLSREGIGILFATSDLDEVMALSDRIAVMSNGKLTGLFERAEATEAAIVAASALGHGPAKGTGRSAHV